MNPRAYQEKVMADFLQAMQLGRVENGGRQKGALVDLREAPQPLYLVGDVHAKASRIEVLLQSADLHRPLSRGEAYLVFLGDLFHREEDHRAGEMESSLETFEKWIELKTRYPQHTYVLLGNHEFTRTGRCKRGYFQGALFRDALESRGIAQTYERFLELSPLAVAHSGCAGVHAGPCTSATTLEELESLQALDVEASQLARGVVEMTCHRHVSWCPFGEKAYNDYDCDDFLKLCGVHQGPLICGHTPLDRETGWEWPLGPRNHIIFAAGRELGYFRIDLDGYRFVRVGRSLPQDDDQILLDRTPRDLRAQLVDGQELVQEGGMDSVRLRGPGPFALLPDVLYRFDYDSSPLSIQAEEEVVRICHYRHLSPSSQAYYGFGYYLVGQELRQEVLHLKRHQAVLVGGKALVRDQVRFSNNLLQQETLVLWQWEDGQFGLRALVEGLHWGELV